MTKPQTRCTACYLFAYFDNHLLSRHGNDFSLLGQYHVNNCATNYVVSHFKTIEKVVLLLSNHHYQHRDFKFCFMVTLSIIGSWAA